MHILRVFCTLTILLLMFFRLSPAYAVGMFECFGPKEQDKIKNCTQVIKLFSQVKGTNTRKLTLEATAYRMRAYGYLRKRKIDEALSDINQSIKLNPKQAGSYLLRGLIYKLKVRYSKAVKDFNKYIIMEPKEYQGYFQRGYQARC